MMYRALIVDDEPMIRYGLSSCVDWAKEGIELAGEANNGESALELVREREIDILITDIKMPKMDGLELIRQAMEIRPHLKAILISSYSDFEYARKAVQLGVVVDYLLKPTMEPEDLLPLLAKSKSLLDEEKAREQASDQYAFEQERKRRRELGLRIKRLLSGQPEDIEWRPQEMTAPYLLSIWRLEPAEAAQSGRTAGRLSRTELIAEQLEAMCVCGAVCMTTEDELVLVLPYRNGAAGAELRTYHEQLLGRGYRFTVGISPSFHQLHRLPDAFGWAENALLQSFFHGKGRCYDGEIATAIQAGTPPSREASEWKAAIDRLSRALADSDRAACERELQLVFDLWRKRSLPPPQIITQATGVLIMMASRQYHLKTEEKMQSLLEHLRGAQQAYTLDDLIEYVRRQFESVWEIEPIRLIAEDAGGLHAIQVALTYIQEHYRGDLSLQEVADYVHMSKNYFSEQFKRRTGMGFIDFVIRLRIGFAKHLLETTTFKVYDVGSLAGFNSPKHFLKLFKREVRCTPAEYRQRWAPE